GVAARFRLPDRDRPVRREGGDAVDESAFVFVEIVRIDGTRPERGGAVFDESLNNLAVIAAHYAVVHDLYDTFEGGPLCILFIRGKTATQDIRQPFCVVQADPDFGGISQDEAGTVHG